MPNTGTRQAKRTPVTLKIKFKSATLDQFIERYSVDVSHGGIFIRTKDPLAVGTTLKFEFQLKDASPLIRGEGTVVWTREHDASRAGVAPGMGVRFDRLPPESQEVLDQILTQKASKGSQRARKPSNPGQFGDVPTRVAPSPLVDGLKSQSADAPGSDKIMGLAPPKGGFGGEGDRTDATPLPTPMPFHSDADDFPEEAFEEATRVAALNPDLVAKTARDDDGEEEDLFGEATEQQTAAEAARDEIAAKRAEKERAAKEQAEREAAEREAAEREAAEKKQAEEERAAKEQAEREAAEKQKANEKQAARESAEREAAEKKQADDEAAAKKREEKAAEEEAAAAAAAEAPPEKRSSGSIIALAAAAVVILGVGGYVVLEMDKRDEPSKTEPVAGEQQPEPAVEPPVEPEQPAPEPEPAAEMVEVAFESAPEGATVALVDGDQSGTVPFTFEIEKGTTAEVRVSKPGFIDQVVTIEDGKKTPRVKLAPKPRVVTIESSPAGATVVVNGKRQKGVTPIDVALTGSLARSKTIRVTLRKSGFATGKTSFAAASAPWSEGDESMTHTVSVPLRQRAVAVKRKPDKKDDDKVAVKKDAPKKDDAAKKDVPDKKDDTVAVKKDDAKKDEPKKDDAKKDEPKKDEPKKDDAKKDDAKKDVADIDEGPTPDWMK